MQKTETTIALIEHEGTEAEATRGRCHADDTLTIPGFNYCARDNFAMGVATGLGVSRRDGARVTGARAGSVSVDASVIIDGGVEAAVAFTSSLIDQANPLVHEFRFEPCTVSGVRIEESAGAAAPTQTAPAEAPAEPAPPPAPAMIDYSPLRVIDVVIHGDDEDGHPEEEIEGRDLRVEEPVAAATPAEAAPAEAPAEPAPPPASVMTDYSPLRVIDVVFHDNDDNRHPDEEIKGCDGGLWNCAEADNHGELDEEEEAMRQDSGVAPWDSGRASTVAVAAAGTAVGFRLRRMISDNFHAERSVDTGYFEQRWHRLTRRDKSSSLPAPNDTSAIGRTYDDIAKSPPPHLWCVVSHISSLSPVLRCTTPSRPRFYAADVPELKSVQAVCSSRGCHSVVWCSMFESVSALGLWPTRYSRASGDFIDVRTMGDSIDVTHICDFDFDARERGAFMRARNVATVRAAAAANAECDTDTIGDDFHAEHSVDTDVLTCREEPPSSPTPEDASKTGRTYDDITKSPPLWCVLSPLSSLSPILHCTAAPLPRFLMSPTPLDDCGQRGTHGIWERASTSAQRERPSTSQTTPAPTKRSVATSMRRAASTRQRCAALRTARRRRPTDSSALASTLAWVATDTRKPKQSAGAPEAVAKISLLRARSSWSRRHGQI